VFLRTRGLEVGKVYRVGTALVSHGYSSPDRQHARRSTVHRSPKSAEGQRTIDILLDVTGNETKNFFPDIYE